MLSSVPVQRNGFLVLDLIHSFLSLMESPAISFTHPQQDYYIEVHFWPPSSRWHSLSLSKICKMLISPGFESHPVSPHFSLLPPWLQMGIAFVQLLQDFPTQFALVMLGLREKRRGCWQRN